MPIGGRRFGRAAARAVGPALRATAPGAARQVLEELLAQPVREEERVERRRIETRAEEQALLNPAEQALIEKRHGLEPGTLKGVRLAAVPTALPRPPRAGRDVLSKLLQEQRSILSGLKSKEIRRIPGLRDVLLERQQTVNAEIDALRGREERPEAPAAPAAPPTPGVSPDVESQGDRWIETRPRVGARKKIGNMLLEFRGAGQVAIIQRK